MNSLIYRAAVALFALASAVSASSIPFATYEVLTYATPNCTGPFTVARLLAFPRTCYYVGPYAYVSVKGELIQASWEQLNCPRNSVSYGDTSCSTTIPLSDFCIFVGPTQSTGVRCPPVACAPEPALDKKRCDARVGVCATYFEPMKW
jgi:hypothetical protein